MSLMATATGIELSFIDGVRGEDVPDKVLPPGAEKLLLSAGSRGNWRAHMDALNGVIRENLATALIIEDDVDWDFRIKRQLVQFARGTTALTQPLRGGRLDFADPTFPNPSSKASRVDIDMNAAPDTMVPSESPYGDLWEVLWLGHCGTNFPQPDFWPLTPRGRAVFADDITVPQTQHLSAYNRLTFDYSSGELEQSYPNHTRIVHHSAGTACTLAYAVTQLGARRMLYDFGLRLLNGQYDLMLSQYCDGKNGRQYHNCLTIQPALIKHHRPAIAKSGLSDISSHSPGDDNFTLSESFTNHIRVSSRINLQGLLEGDETLIDSYPDAAPSPPSALR